MEELVVSEIRYLELTKFVSEENVRWIDANDGLTVNINKRRINKNKGRIPKKMFVNERELIDFILN
jgi:hypothetical protein